MTSSLDLTGVYICLMSANISSNYQVLSNWLYNFQRIILISHQLCDLYLVCSTQTFMLMEVSAWTSYKISGVLSMMLLLFLPPSSHCFVTQTQTLLPIQKLHEYSARINVSTTGECERLLSRAGQRTKRSWKAILMESFRSTCVAKKNPPITLHV